MKLENLSLEELELMSYTDLTYQLIKENKKPMTTSAIFKEICNLLDYSDSDYAAKIGDYYTSLTLDKRFVLLDSNEWDIRDNHSVKIEIDEDEEEEIEDTLDIEEEVEEVEEDDLEIDDDNEVLDDDDDIDDLAVLTEDELEEE